MNTENKITIVIYYATTPWIFVDDWKAERVLLFLRAAFYLFIFKFLLRKKFIDKLYFVWEITDNL